MGEGHLVHGLQQRGAPREDREGGARLHDLGHRPAAEPPEGGGGGRAGAEGAGEIQRREDAVRQLFPLLLHHHVAACELAARPLAHRRRRLGERRGGRQGQHPDEELRQPRGVREQPSRDRVVPRHSDEVSLQDVVLCDCSADFPMLVHNENSCAVVRDQSIRSICESGWRVDHDRVVLAGDVLHQQWLVPTLSSDSRAGTCSLHITFSRWGLWRALRLRH
mmetsp:Transcript_90465/g.230059  ORF Transcript_90465/g.230059 Transcript_90465/m.230059 type:complete len:221 (-) Transcript_90465:125-787(-)